MFKEGCRIEVFADELRRRGEENQRNAQTDSTTLSERGLIDLDIRDISGRPYLC